LPHIQDNKISGDTQQLLQQAFNEALWTLGTPVAKTILWHLQNRGAISLTGKAFEMDRVHAGLQEILGPGIELVLQSMYQSFSRNFSMNTIIDFELQHSSKSYLQKIHLLIQKMQVEVEN